MRKPRIRIFSDGKLFRLWPSVMGIHFPTGPYCSIEEALKFKDFHVAAKACGYTTKRWEPA